MYSLTVTAPCAVHTLYTTGNMLPMCSPHAPHMLSLGNVTADAAQHVGCGAYGSGSGASNSVGLALQNDRSQADLITMLRSGSIRMSYSR